MITILILLGLLIILDIAALYGGVDSRDSFSGSNVENRSNW